MVLKKNDFLKERKNLNMLSAFKYLRIVSGRIVVSLLCCFKE